MGSNPLGRTSTTAVPGIYWHFLAPPGMRSTGRARSGFSRKDCQEMPAGARSGQPSLQVALQNLGRGDRLARPCTATRAGATGRLQGTEPGGLSAKGDSEARRAARADGHRAAFLGKGSRRRGREAWASRI